MRLAFADTGDEFNRQLFSDGCEAHRIDTYAARAIGIMEAEKGEPEILRFHDSTPNQWRG